MFFKGKHEAARMELRFINKTGNRHFDKTSYVYYVYVYVYVYVYDNIYIYITGY